MRYSMNVLNILTSLTYKGIGKAWVVKNIKGGEHEEVIVSLLNQSVKDKIITRENFQKRKSQLEKHLVAASSYMDGAVAIGDEMFPKHRGKVKNSEKPVVLFYKGDITLLAPTNKNIAVIGVLEPDVETKKDEELMVQALVQQGATIVSGLANGCDAIAHQQAILSQGKTVAILPSPLHNILPAGNRTLAQKILETHGLLVTEYLYDAKSKMVFTGRYQERDRLQALFSDAIILTSSYAKNNLGNDSGSRLAMQYAYQYGIPRCVMYDEQKHTGNPKFDLNRQIISEQKEVIVINTKNLNAAISQVMKISHDPLTLIEKQTDLF